MGHMLTSPYNQNLGQVQTPTGQNQVPGPLTGAAPGASAPGAVSGWVPPPSPEQAGRFLPPILRDPFVSGMNVAGQVGSWAGAALPAASGFQHGLYSPTLNPMEQAFMTSGANQGLRGLEQAFNQIDAQYGATPFHSSRGNQMIDAANQFADQMLGRASQLGLQRQQLAAQTLPTTFGLPLQAATAQQEMGSGLYSLAQQGMYGDLEFPMAMYSNYPIIPPVVTQRGGGKKS